MSLPPFDKLLITVKQAIQAARKLWRPQYVALTYAIEPGGFYVAQPVISGSALIVIHPTGELVGLHQHCQVTADLNRRVRAALLAER